MGTCTVSLALPVQEGPLLQYGSPTRTHNPNPKLIERLMQYISGPSHACVQNANTDEIEQSALIVAIF